MTIEKKMKEVLAQPNPSGPDNPEFQRLREFYEQKKKEGVVKKQEYDLPPLDTIGRSLYNRYQDEKE